MIRRALFFGLLSLCAVVSEARPPAARLAAGDHYVAMGSSFAAGPGVTTPADSPPNRCTRSRDNYAHQIAARLALELTDVSCGGATTAHILGRWNELPPQLDALRRDTKLVTITIGGNDVGYIAGLFAASCAERPTTTLCRGFAARQTLTPQPQTDEAAWLALESHLDQIAGEVRRRSPAARLVFVDYLTILPRKALCSAMPLGLAQAKAARAKAARLAAVTARVADKAGALIVRASQLSARHGACATHAWMNGFPAEGSSPALVGYHPNLAGMTAVADAIERRLRRK
jgi:lysophospholipase L1-like esterase